MLHLVAIAIGFTLDLVLGDPHGWPHPVVWMGKLIDVLEKGLRAVFAQTKFAECIAGVILVVCVCTFSTICACVLLWLGGLVSPILELAVESILCYQMLATKSLRDESMSVYEAVVDGNLEQARHRVSMIVGRDTQHLDEAGVTRAAVETIAENTNDGVVAPLLFMALGAAPCAVFYKAVNTMDSMVGYRNERYLWFGACAARLDDVLNFIPARIAGVLMCLAAAAVRLDARGAWRIFCRDRKAHSSPNAAHTEAACAGALGVQLSGPNTYFGKIVEKPRIADATRPIEPDDIKRANCLLYGTAVLGFFVALAVRASLATLGVLP